MGEATGDPHHRVEDSHKGALPMILVDHAFTAVASLDPDEDGLLSKTLLCIDRDSGATFAIVCDSAESAEHGVKALRK